jgi:hypothetical protein
MDKRRTKVFRDKLLDRREGLVGQVQAAELYSRERDAELRNCWSRCLTMIDNCLT